MLRLPRLFACMFAFALAAIAEAGSPRLARITPPGGQRGTTVEVHLAGRYLDSPQEVIFYESGIAVEAIDEQPQRRNDRRETAKDVPMASTIIGRMNDPTDVDLYKVEARRGDRISAEIEAARIGVERGLPDLHLAILDADGKPLLEADDSALFLQDPVVSRMADRDGTYFVQVRHCTYSAANETYRLHVGSFPRPTGLYPAGGQAGPEGDYFRLTRQIVGRRINLAVPEKSLMLEKTTGVVQHTGGKLFDADNQDYKTLLRWIAAGAPNDTGETPEPVGIELLPAKAVFAGGGATQRTVVRAKYSDGSSRDVTPLALFMTNNDAVASIGKDGVAKGNGRGGAFVFARFNKFTVGSEVIVLPTDDKFRWPDVAEHNYIDTLVFDKLRKLHMAPSDLCSDEAFLRRAYLDLIGLPPSRDEYDRFVADADPAKRAKLIDALIDRAEFVDMWAMKWGEMLRVRAGNNQPQYGRDAKAMWSYAAWVHDQMARNRPLNEFVADLLVGAGSNFTSPTANLYTATERLTPQKTAEDIAQVFLGQRIQCAQCHNHPFDRWTMDDYYGFASFFAGVNLKRGVEGREVIVFNNNAANTVEHPVDGRRMKPKFLGGAAPAVDGQDPRKSLATWLTATDNTAFRETMANVVWAHFFGRGIVEPVDDVRISNPPSNRELLAELGKKLAEYGFDKKRLVRDICNSRTYQLSAAPNETNELDEAYFSHSYVRRLRAEVLLDTISRVTETEDRFPQSPPGTRAVQIHSGNISNYFLTTFGRAPRESACSCEVNPERLNHLTSLQAQVDTNYRRGEEQLARLKTEMENLRRDGQEAAALANLDNQIKNLERQLASIRQRYEGSANRLVYADILWGLFNSTEFAFNH